MKGTEFGFPAAFGKARNKYGAKKTQVGGITFDSAKEADYYMQLLLLKKAGDVVDIKRQVRYELQPGFYHRCKYQRPIAYVADFVVTYKGGRVEVVDVKGVKTEVYKLKKKLLLFKYPDLYFVEV